LNGVAFANSGVSGFTPGMRVIATVSLVVSDAIIAEIDAKKGAEHIANITPTSVSFKTSKGVVLAGATPTLITVKFHSLQRGSPTLGRLVSINLPSVHYFGTAYCTAFGVVGASVSDAGGALGTAPGDSNWAQVQLRLVGAGADGSTVITDSSSFNRTPIAGYAASVSDDVQLFGANTLRLPAGFQLAYTSNAWHNLNDGDWTIDVWAYELTGGGGSLMSRRAGGTSRGWAWTRSGLRAHINGVWSDTQMTWAAPPVNEWHLYSLVRAGSALYAFVDGVLVATKTGVTSMDDQSLALVIGQSDNASENRFNGYLSNVRWTKGVARYTGNFPVPTTGWPDDTPVVVVPPSTPDAGGLLGRYYNNTDLVGLPAYFAKEVPAFAGRWGDPEVRPGVSESVGGFFSARWTGFIRPPSTGKWQLILESDDGGNVWFQGLQAINAYGAAAGARATGWLDMEAGTDYSIWVEYVNNAGPGYSISLRWRKQQPDGTPGPEEVIPGSAMSASLPTEPAKEVKLATRHFVTNVNRY